MVPDLLRYKETSRLGGKYIKSHGTRYCVSLDIPNCLLGQPGNYSSPLHCMRNFSRTHFKGQYQTWIYCPESTLRTGLGSLLSRAKKQEKKVFPF